MADDRLLRGFRAFDADVAPDPAFAERLFAELSAELGFGAAGVPARVPVAARVRRALRLDWRPLPPATMRLVYVVASAALLLAALAGAAFVASQLAHRSPLEIVRLSQAAVKDPPPFVLVYRNATGQEARLAYDGSGTWRSDDPDGSYGLWDGSRQGYYNGQGKTWGIVDVPVTQAPFILLMDMWSWTSTAVPGSEGVPTPVDCADATWVEEATVAGRPADHLRCPSWDVDYWIDRDSHLVLKFLAGPTAPGWVGDAPDVVIRGMEAVSLDLSPPNAAAFSWDGPVGAYDESNPPPSTVLAVGAPAPTWTGETVDGATLTLPVPEKPTAVLFAAAWCSGACAATFDAASNALAAHPDVGGAIVLNDHPGTAVGYRSLHPTTASLVADPDNLFYGAWGVNSVPTLVLLDRSGSVAYMASGTVAPDELDRLLSSLAVGDPLPSTAPPTPVPASSPDATPAPTPEPHGLMPAWKGALLGGGTLDSTTLRGKPTVVYFATGLQAQGDSPVDESLVAFGRALPAMRSRANVVTIISAEWTPGSFGALLDRLGIDVPTVLDWDSAVSRAIYDGIQMPDGFSTLVFDADGRLVTAVSTPTEGGVTEALDLAASGSFPPLPTPMP